MFRTYREDFEKLSANHNKLARMHEDLKKKYEAEKQVTASLTKKLGELADSFEDFLDRYELVITTPEYYNKEREDLIDELKRQASKAYGCGRQDAYAEMGIRNIEAHERGNCLAILEDGNIVELITNLETVYEEPAPEEAKGEPEAVPEAVPEWALERCEIVIDDIEKM